VINESTIGGLSSVLASTLPAAFAIVWQSIALFNLWLAGVIVEASGRPLRALAGSSTPSSCRTLSSSPSPRACSPPSYRGIAGLLATGFAGALLFAYVLQGLAVLHAFSRGHAVSRPHARRRPISASCSRAGSPSPSPYSVLAEPHASLARPRCDAWAPQIRIDQSN
jgi:hypothetical protein